MKPVAKGENVSFEFETKLPAEFIDYTAIGNIIYRAYYLVLTAEVGCCISNPKTEIHTVVTTTVLPEP